jgi:hypothetical protein
LTSFPRELHLNILTFLRATDLSALQRTCSTFNKRDLIVDVVEHAANEVVSICPSDNSATLKCIVWCYDCISLTLQSIPISVSPGSHGRI